jgi:thymidylate synthase ThyX
MNNTVELLGFYGSDEVIACSAWTSTSRELTDDKKSRIPSLIDMLWSNGHETPFEKATVHFLVNCDIASHIHLLKHRMASINAESARYKELKEDKFYIPKDWKGQQLSKDLFLHDEMSEDELSWKKGVDYWSNVLQDFTDISQLFKRLNTCPW